MKRRANAAYSTASQDRARSGGFLISGREPHSFHPTFALVDVAIEVKPAARVELDRLVGPHDREHVAIVARIVILRARKRRGKRTFLRPHLLQPHVPPVARRIDQRDLHGLHIVRCVAAAIELRQQARGASRDCARSASARRRCRCCTARHGRFRRASRRFFGSIRALTTMSSARGCAAVCTAVWARV